MTSDVLEQFEAQIRPHAERVVYILGAGFSAPLGLPVVSNFLTKSKDMFARFPSRYAYFKEVYDHIRDLDAVQTYLRADMLDIEEVLSIVEMRAMAAETDLRDEVVRYIIDVIRHYTPDPLPAKPPRTLPELFEEQLLWRPYLSFVASLLRLEADREKTSSGAFTVTFKHSATDAPVRYDVVTVNYDVVLETAREFIVNEFRVDLHDFVEAPQAQHPHAPSPAIAKLHGCIQRGNIVPPTWNKTLNEAITLEWRLAHQLLRQANHIRIIGYSLPPTDSYIRYLIKAAVAMAENLKTVDVLCRDPQGTVWHRYRDFFTYKNLRFVDGDTAVYLARNRGAAQAAQGGPAIPTMSFAKLEEAHEQFFEHDARTHPAPN